MPLVAQVRDLLGDGTTFKRRVKEGEGEFPADCPMHDCDIKCHYVARTIPDRIVVYGAALLVLATLPRLDSRPCSAVGDGYARRCHLPCAHRRPTAHTILVTTSLLGPAFRVLRDRRRSDARHTVRAPIHT